MLAVFRQIHFGPLGDRFPLNLGPEFNHFKAPCLLILTISSQSVHNFLSGLVHKQNNHVILRLCRKRNMDL